MHSRSNTKPAETGFLTWLALSALLVGLTGCGGGGGGGGALSGGSGSTPSEGITLLSITFPETVDLTGGSIYPPPAAPLSQQVVFTFSGPPEGTIGPRSIVIYADVGSDYAGPESVIDFDTNTVPARGIYEVFDNIVVFTPLLPTQTIDLMPNAPAQAVPGLLPGSVLGMVGTDPRPYTIYIPLNTSGAISNLRGVDPSVTNPVTMTTGDIANLYFSNFHTEPPRVLATEPADGAVDVPLNPFQPVPGWQAFEGFSVRFDQPLNPELSNLVGSDCDGDEVRDPNVFLRFNEPLLYAATQGIFPNGVVRIDRNDPGTSTWDTFVATTYQSAPVDLEDVGLDGRGNLVGLAGGRLYQVDGSTGELSDEIDLGVPSLEGLAFGPDGILYAIDGATGRLYRFFPPDYSIELIGVVDKGTQAVDLAYGDDDRLYLLRQEQTHSSVVSYIDALDRESAASEPLTGGFSYAFTSMAFVESTLLCLFAEMTQEIFTLDVQQEILISRGVAAIPFPDLQLDLASIGYRLEVDSLLLENGLDGSLMSIDPRGLLPFGAPVEVMVRNGLENVTFSTLAQTEGLLAEGVKRIARFTTWDPGPTTVEDVFLEDFDDNLYESREIALGQAQANWNFQDVDPAPPKLERLLASFGLGGSGELGDFVPLGIFPVIVLDTDSQNFPLWDGSTPDIQESITIKGGTFHFDDILIPEGVTVLGRGSNPLVLTATGHVSIAGTVDVSGLAGMRDVTFNSGFTPVPGGLGGPGGGRGGAGQPSIPANFQSLKELQTPPFGERGWGYSNLRQIGGAGGETGANSTSVPFGANQGDKESRGAGGGGGSFLAVGDPGREGKGRYGVGPDEVPYIRPGDAPPAGGLPGDPIFVDSDSQNDFFGGTGELQFLIGGQGGGGAGTRWDSLNPSCANLVQGTIYPQCLYDAKGGGAGGGAGSMAIHALGAIQIGKTGRLLAVGGAGGGGEMIGGSNFGGAAGGGSGGAIILQSGTLIKVIATDPINAAEINVTGGRPSDAKEKTGSVTALPPRWCNEKPPHPSQFCSYSEGDGGQGGHGLIQLMVDDPATKIDIAADAYVGATVMEIDWENLSPKGFPYYKFTYFSEAVVDPYKTVASISSLTYGMSRWIDFGQVIQRPPIPVGPDLVAPPVFLGFEGTDPLTGLVITQNGYVRNFHIPGLNDIEVHSPDLSRTNYIAPDNAVSVEFQGARAAFPGASFPLEPATPWTADITDLSGYQFIRFRAGLNVSLSGNLTPDAIRPQANFVRIRTRY